MKRQDFFPTSSALHPEWFTNLAGKIDGYAATLSLPAALVTELKEDCLYCAYAAGEWLTAVRSFSLAATAALETLYTGSSAGDYALPVFTPPALPAGVDAVAAGALNRIFRTVQDIKNAKGYITAIGLDLGLEGAVAGPPPALPTFKLKVLTGTGCECVRVEFRKYGRLGVAVESRRGTGDWEMLGFDSESPYLDERPLLNPAQPEVREFRLRFWGKDGPTGDYTDVARATVSPT